MSLCFMAVACIEAVIIKNRMAAAVYFHSVAKQRTNYSIKCNEEELICFLLTSK